METNTYSSQDINIYRAARIPSCESEYRKLADELEEWAARDNNFTMLNFPRNIMMDVHTFHQLPDKSEYFCKRYDNALRTLGERRLKGGRNLNMNIVNATQALYDPNYRKYIREKLRQ